MDPLAEDGRSKYFHHPAYVDTAKIAIRAKRSRRTPGHDGSSDEAAMALTPGRRWPRWNDAAGDEERCLLVSTSRANVIRLSRKDVERPGGFDNDDDRSNAAAVSWTRKDRRTDAVHRLESLAGETLTSA